MEYRKIKDLTPLDGNPRSATDEALKKLSVSISGNKDYFEARPIILSNRTGDLVVIGGNQRLKAAKLAGLKDVPTFLIEGLTEAKEREIIIRDNVNNGRWDFSMLNEFFSKEELSLFADIDFAPSEDAKEMFEPTLDPAFGGVEVTEEGFDKKESELDAEFRDRKHNEEHILTCPSCQEKFGINLKK